MSADLGDEDLHGRCRLVASSALPSDHAFQMKFSTDLMGLGQEHEQHVRIVTTRNSIKAADSKLVVRCFQSHILNTAQDGIEMGLRQKHGLHVRMIWHCSTRLRALDRKNLNRVSRRKYVLFQVKIVASRETIAAESPESAVCDARRLLRRNMR